MQVAVNHGNLNGPWMKLLQSTLEEKENDQANIKA
jgi:hypothetical protein